VLGPTYANRDFLYGGTSQGTGMNAAKAGGSPLTPTLKDFPGTDLVIFDELEKRHIPWAIYSDGPGLSTFLGYTALLTRWKQSGIPIVHLRLIGKFFDDAASGDLPQVTFVDPKLAFEKTRYNNDEHPPGDIQWGQQFVSQVAHALLKSPQWPHLAFFLAWDEHGGIYDHVAPPAACAPDGFAPNLVSTADKQYGPADGFARYGVRVPLIVMSPFVKKSYVSHNVYDHTSILRFIETKFKVPALTARDANADPLFDFFDFNNPPFVKPPSLPDATVDATQANACVQNLGLGYLP
jgi:phospholipase C